MIINKLHLVSLRAIVPCNQRRRENSKPRNIPGSQGWIVFIVRQPGLDGPLVLASSSGESSDRYEREQYTRQVLFGKYLMRARGTACSE